jgi:hypothetical protein
MNHERTIPSWEASEVLVRDCAVIFAAVRRQSARLLAHYPDVAVRRLARGEAHRPLLTAGALVTLWEQWPVFTGFCPVCDGSVLGTSFNGMLSSAHVFGVCVRCTRAQRRWVGGGVAGVHSAANRHLAGTRFRCGSPWARTDPLPYADLVAALQDLGEPDLDRTGGARLATPPAG